jgi:hypothetical protein
MVAAMFLMMFGAPKEYPLRLRIVHIDERTSVRYGYSSGHGVGNLREEDGTLHGIDFDFDGCDSGLKASVGPLWYQARLKKEFKLGVVKTELGSDKMEECEFKYKPQTFRYVIKNGHITTAPTKVVPLGEQTE